MLLVSALLIVFKDDIKDYALEEINRHLNKRVHIGYIDVGLWKTFPNMSLEFDDVLIHSRFGEEQTKDTALFAKTIRLRFSPLDFVKGNYTVNEIDIEQAVFNMRIKKDGRVNYDFIKPSESTDSTNFEFSLEGINIINTRYSYINEATDQSYSTKINEMSLAGYFTEEKYTLNAKTDFWVNAIRNKSITLISNKDAKCDIAISVDQTNNVFEIINADLKINELPFTINGKVTHDSLNFYIGSKSLDLAEVANNFTVQELGMVEELNGAGQVAIDVYIRGEVESTKSPAIDADFKISNGSLNDKGFAISAINAKGHYSNGIAKRKERLTISSISFNSLGSDFNGKVDLTDFDKPRLVGNAKGWLNLKMIHRLFGPFDMSELSGAINLNGKFDLRLNDPKHDPKNISIYNLRSNFEMDKITAKFIGDQRLFEINSGELVIRNQQAVFKNVKVKVVNSDILIDGTFNRIADYFMQKQDLIVDASIESNYLAVDDLSAQSNTAPRQQWLLPNDIRGKVILGLNKVVYGGHTYSEINSRMNFDKRALHFPVIKGKNAGSNIDGRLTVTEKKPMVLTLKTNIHSPNIQFDRLFKEWNNFDQDVIKAENIRGIANIDLDFEGAFNLFTGEVYKDEFIADINVKIKNGALVNVGTFKEITSSLKETGARLLISKNKIDDFEKALLDLKFDNFENRLKIENGVLYIPKMEIKSNALDLKVSGEHSFDNIVDYSFDFRFRELKGKSKESEFGDIVDDGTGFRIYLKMFGELDNPSFAWDKDAKKEDRKEQREEAKEEFKSVLKTGLGINKKDSTVQVYEEKEKPKEKLIMEFDKDTLENDFNPDNKEKKKTRLQEKLDKWKKENEDENKKEEIEFD